MIQITRSRGRDGDSPSTAHCRYPVALSASPRATYSLHRSCRTCWPRRTSRSQSGSSCDSASRSTPCRCRRRWHTGWIACRARGRAGPLTTSRRIAPIIPDLGYATLCILHFSGGQRCDDQRLMAVRPALPAPATRDAVFCPVRLGDGSGHASEQLSACRFARCLPGLDFAAGRDPSPAGDGLRAKPGPGPGRTPRRRRPAGPGPGMAAARRPLATLAHRRGPWAAEFL